MEQWTSHLRDLQDKYPQLYALMSRGPFSLMGEPLSFLRIEVLGPYLCITGAAPLRDDGQRYTHTGAEYTYWLYLSEAEKLLCSLQETFHDRPERVIARQFEFSAPQNSLAEYLNALKLNYEYRYTKGGRL